MLHYSSVLLYFQSEYRTLFHKILYIVQNLLRAAVALSLSCTDEKLSHCIRCDIWTNLTSTKLMELTSKTTQASENCQSHSLNIFRHTHRCWKTGLFPVHHRPCCYKCFNPPDVRLWSGMFPWCFALNCMQKKALHSDYGFTSF